MSVMPLLALKPHWLLGRFSSAMVGLSLFGRILANALLSMYRVMMIASQKSYDILPCFQQQTIRS